MYKYIVLLFCVGLSGVICDLNKEEGADCEWDGVKGKCVKETQCFTTLDKRGDQHLVCSKAGDVTIVCCTDCSMIPGCLQYLNDLPYRCRDGGFYSGVTKSFNEEKKCHSVGLWGIGGAPPPGHVAGQQYPHQALLGFGDELASAKWSAGGSIISNKYILTAAHVNTRLSLHNGGLKFVALDVKKRSDGPSAWQIHKVKRFIAHPNYKAASKYDDIALIETETTINFNKDVLPACVHVEEASTEKAVATTWRDLTATSRNELADTIQTINLDQFSEEECKTAYSSILASKEGIDYNTQMCYGSKTHAPEACRGLSGEPLLVDTQFSSCIYTIIGVTSFGKANCGPNTSTPDVFTRVAHYKPWIESVVWA